MKSEDQANLNHAQKLCLFLPHFQLESLAPRRGPIEMENIVRIIFLINFIPSAGGYLL